jgi:glycosyltransferase involved in cell wall biosynthesis
VPVSRIVIINDTSWALGGTERLALLSAQLFRARGFDVTFICGDDGSNDHLTELDVDVVAAGQVSLLQKSRAQAIIRGVYDGAARDLVAKYIREHDTPETVYHVHGWAQVLSPSIFKALAPVANRTFTHAHDMFLACPNGVYMDYRHDQVCARRPLSLSCIATNCDKRSYAHKIWRVARQKYLFNSFDQRLPWAGIIQIHPAMQERLTRAGYPGDVLRVVRNPSTPYSDTRIEAENNDGIVYVGRLEKDKGAIEIAEAATRAGMALTMVGDGSLRDTLERDFPDVQFAGWQPREAVGDFVRQARFLAMPSLHSEPFALVIPEAVKSGLPVIVSETALMSAEIETAKLGLSVNIFDRDAVDRAIATLRDMPAQDLRQISERGFSDQVQLSQTPDAWAEQLLDLYQQAVAA